jgi:hypothetical protein
LTFSLWTFLENREVDSTDNAEERAMLQSEVNTISIRVSNQHVLHFACRDHHPAVSGPHCLAVTRAGLDYSSLRRSDALTSDGTLRTE